jgi:ATP-dependent Zn protease
MAAINGAVQKLTEEVSKRAGAILLRNRAVLDWAAGLLLSKKTLQGPDLEGFTSSMTRRPAKQAAE